MKRIIFSLVVVFSMLLLSGCGASVTSKTSFNSDGGGTRSISAVISASDAKNLTNGFDELDILLRQAAPEGITINRTNLENGDAQYQFSIQFSNIEDYNQKISTITGTSHKATWYTGTNAFQSNVRFTEKECTYDLISWAIDAFKDSKYSAFSSYFTLYDVSRSEFYYEDQLVYSGTGNPSFTVETSPKLKQVNVYSDLAYDKVSKTIELLFERGSLEKIDLASAREMLESYSNQVSIDTANGRIVYTLEDRESILSFLERADARNQTTSLSYELVNNPFQEKYILQENFYLTDLLNNFTIDDPNVYYYVKLPKQADDAKFSQNGLAVEAVGQYDYGTSVNKDYSYTMEASSNHLVDLKDIGITYEVSSDLNCKRVVEITYIKNNCAITESQLAEYFPDIDEKISFFDEGDSIRLVFVSWQTKKDAFKQGLGFEKLSRQNLKYIRHVLKENLDLSRYLPVIEGYRWNLDQIRYHYQVKIEDKAGLYEASAGNEQYNSDAHTLEQLKHSNSYVITGEDTADHPVILELGFKQMYQFYYFWLIAIIFLIIVVVLGFALYYTKKKSPLIKETMEENETIGDL